MARAAETYGIGGHCPVSKAERYLIREGLLRSVSEALEILRSTRPAKYGYLSERGTSTSLMGWLQATRHAYTLPAPCEGPTESVIQCAPCEGDPSCKGMRQCFESQCLAKGVDTLGVFWEPGVLKYKSEEGPMFPRSKIEYGQAPRTTIRFEESVPGFAEISWSTEEKAIAKVSGKKIDATRQFTGLGFSSRVESSAQAMITYNHLPADQPVRIVFEIRGQSAVNGTLHAGDQLIGYVSKRAEQEPVHVLFIPECDRF